MPDRRTRSTRTIALVLGVPLVVSGISVFALNDRSFGSDVVTAVVVVLGLGVLRYGWPRRGQASSS